MASTYSFDVVSDFDQQELVNAIDQVRRDLSQRYDLKGSNSKVEIDEDSLMITAESEMTLSSIEDIIRQKAIKRNLSLKIFDFQPPEKSGGNQFKQKVNLKRGLSQDLAKKLSKSLRDGIKKINVSIQGDSLRVNGKSKDDLQEAISLLKEEEKDLEIPLQFENYR